MVKLSFNGKDNTFIKSGISKKKEIISNSNFVNFNPFVCSEIFENLNETITLETFLPLGLENTYHILKNWYLKNDKILLMIGPIGCGKTTLIYHFCKENDISLLDIKTKYYFTFTYNFHSKSYIHSLEKELIKLLSFTYNILYFHSSGNKKVYCILRNLII